MAIQYKIPKSIRKDGFLEVPMPGCITIKDGVHFFAGTIDETVDLSVVSQISGALRLDFGDLVQVNSVGIARFVRMLQAYGHGKLEYHRCPPQFLSLIGTIDSLLGPKKDPTIVKSVFIEFSCSGCQQRETHLVKTSDIQKSGSYFNVKPRPCTKCGVILRVVDELEDLLSFMY